MTWSSENSNSLGKELKTGRGLKRFASFLLGGACLFLLFAIWLRYQEGDEIVQPSRPPNYPAPGILPKSFATDGSPEAQAFRATCALCHGLPSPRLHDQDGWLGVKRMMGAQMAERGMTISQRQIDLAIEYAIRHARPPIKPFPTAQPKAEEL